MVEDLKAKHFSCLVFGVNSPTAHNRCHITQFGYNIVKSRFSHCSKVVSISFQSVDTENNYDFIDVYDGNSVSAKLIVELTGFNPQRLASYSTTQRNMFVQFKSDFINPANGFIAAFSATVLSTPGEPVQDAEKQFQYTVHMTQST